MRRRRSSPSGRLGMRSLALALAAMVAASLASFPGTARAQDFVAPSEERPLPPLPDYFIPEGPPQRSLALELNPLAIAIGQFSMNIEYVLLPHHVVVMSPSYTYAVPGGADSIQGGGVELGYRYYTGTRAPSGWFLGVSYLYGQYDYVYTTRSVLPAGTCYAFTAPSSCPQNTSYTSNGGAVDAGYQIVLKNGVLVGAGLGLMYRAFTSQPQWEGIQSAHASIDRVYGSGLRPRFLFSFGGAL